MTKTSAEIEASLIALLGSGIANRRLRETGHQVFALPREILPADEVGADGEASPATLDAQEDLRGRLDRIRRLAAQL